MPDSNPYIRQILLNEVGENGQQRIHEAKILIVGSGGLGCPAALFLAGAGVGELIIADDDFVSTDNLHRQILYHPEDLNKPKAISAAEKLSVQFPNQHFTPVQHTLNQVLALDIIPRVDLVLDCTDRIDSRYLINDACALLNKPWIHASVRKFQYQWAVFNPAQDFHYRNLFPVPPNPMYTDTCNSVGVLGTVSGQAGIVQAGQALLWLLGLTGAESRLHHTDTISGDSYSIGIPQAKNEGPTTTADFLKFDYHKFCNSFAF